MKITRVQGVYSIPLYPETLIREIHLPLLPPEEVAKSLFSKWVFR